MSGLVKANKNFGFNHLGLGVRLSHREKPFTPWVSKALRRDSEIGAFGAGDFQHFPTSCKYFWIQVCKKFLARKLIKVVQGWGNNTRKKIRGCKLQKMRLFANWRKKYHLPSRYPKAIGIFLFRLTPRQPSQSSDGTDPSNQRNSYFSICHDIHIAWI